MESRFDPSATNGSCVGLMQINAKVHSERAQRLGVTDVRNPYGNVIVGIDIIAEKLEGYGDTAHALMAYNGGDQYCWRKIAEGTTSTYAITVLSKYEELKQ